MGWVEGGVPKTLVDVFLKRVSNSGLLCRCHACGIAVCFAADLRIVYSGLLYTAVMLVE